MGNVLYTNSTDSRSRQVEQFLQSPHDPRYLKEIGADGILFMKNCADFMAYDWLEKLPNCQKTKETEVYRLYRCK